MPYPGMTEFLVEHELGCGAFQIIGVIVLYVLSAIPTYSTVQLMSFGRYNPGWRCQENISYGHDNYTYNQDSVTRNADKLPRSNLNTTEKYNTKQSCQMFSSCNHIEFNPSASTIVTEWNLLCGQSRVPSTIISIQMGGIFVGSVFSGQLADNIGRKRVFYGSILFMSVFNFVSATSKSWQMFAVCEFFLGVCCSGVLALSYVFPTEFLPRKWRAPLTGIPAWSMSGIFYGLITMALKDWRAIQVTIGSIAVFCFLHVVWVPESLRWLEVKSKGREYKMVVVKIARINNKTIPDIGSSSFIRKVEATTVKTSGRKSSHKATKRYTYIDLFHKGYKLYTVILAMQWLFLNVVYVSITFGISTVGGNFYINLVIMNCLAVPCGIFPILAPNILGRKRSLLTCYVVTALALGVVVILEITATKTTKDTGTIVMIMLIVACIESARGLIVLVAAEIYPTVVRGLSVSWAKTVSRVGGIIAPVFIPTRPESVAEWYLVMVLMTLMCCVSVAFIPETKGRPLKELFEDTDEASESPETVSDHGDTETTRLTY